MKAPAPIVALTLAVAIVALAAPGGAPLAAAAPVALQVTSPAASGGDCPDAAACTLSAAITAANADITGNPVLITFSPSAFPPGSLTVIAPGPAALPQLARGNTTIDGAGASVRIQGSDQNLSATPNGLVLAGAGDALRGLYVDGFAGSCVVILGANVTLGGDSTAGQAIHLGNCGTAVTVNAAGATIDGNHIGFTPAEDNPAPVAIGIQINAPGVMIGDSGGLANVIGNGAIGIQVGGIAGLSFAGPRIAHNVIGRDPQGHPAPVTTSIHLRQPSSGTVATGNDIAYATTGISVAADVGGVSVTSNRFDQNLFHAISGMAIDLDANGHMNPNQPPNGYGANGDINHPVISRAVQARITGSAGADCGGCTVQLYLAEHRTGSTTDYGSVAVAGGVTTADAGGNFSFDNPAVTPGQWVTSLVTDANGNTSEFGPSTRVGTGVAQCGNLQLPAGWNEAGYFGADPVVLGETFPADSSAGAASAIYHYDEASGQFTHWFAGTTTGRTLSTLQPGEAYWFLADAPINLAGGFSLSVALPVSLKTGWNEIVYIGAAASIPDALSSIAGAYRYVYRWTNDGSTASWRAFGDGTEPSWADDFADMQTCSAYEIMVTADTVLTPLQP